MSKKQEQIVEQNAEQEEKEVTKENTVIEVPESVAGDEQVEQAEQEEVAENEVVEVPEDITGDAPVEDKQEETAEVKYKAKACIYYDDRKIMPGETLTDVEADTIHSLLKNGFIELA